jgi:hypothetical protein
MIRSIRALPIRHTDGLDSPIVLSTVTLHAHAIVALKHFHELSRPQTLGPVIGRPL